MRIDFDALANDPTVKALREKQPPTGLPFNLTKIGHVVFNVRDLARSVEFYTQILGLRVSDVYPPTMMPGGMVFLRFSPDHHGLALVGGASEASTSSELHHMAFEVASLDEVLRAREHLIGHGVAMDFEGRRRAGCQLAIEFRDPDGHRLEIYWGLDLIGSDGRARAPGEWRECFTLEEAIDNPVAGQDTSLHDHPGRVRTRGPRGQDHVEDYAMSTRPPVSDWATDWDHLDAGWRNDPFPIWADLRTRCPIAHTERFKGAYLPTRYEDVKAIAYDSAHFSSRRIIVRDEYVETPMPTPPITSDPPEHKADKRMLLPFFTPRAVAALEPHTRAICNELIDGFIAGGHCDAAQAYTRHIPVRVIAHMLGVSNEDGPLFIKWIRQILELGISDLSQFMDGMQAMTAYFNGEIAKRRDAPGDDLISAMMTGERDGTPWTPEQVMGSLRLLMVAGIDTTWSAIGASLWHLARVPEDQARLAAEPSLIPTAVEELLRAYSPVTMAREIVEDAEIGGCPMKAGNMVLLSFPAANRDPQVFERADEVVIDRQPNRHAAFGLGIHRCVGSNLARMEMIVALEEWLKRIPEFSLAGDVTWSEGTVRGPRQLPLAFA